MVNILRFSLSHYTKVMNIRRFSLPYFKKSDEYSMVFANALPKRERPNVMSISFIWNPKNESLKWRNKRVSLYNPFIRMYYRINIKMSMYFDVFNPALDCILFLFHNPHLQYRKHQKVWTAFFRVNQWIIDWTVDFLDRQCRTGRVHYKWWVQRWFDYRVTKSIQTGYSMDFDWNWSRPYSKEMWM